ncbi:MAG: phage tail protein [Leeuwenhoekiella sp.]
MSYPPVGFHFKVEFFGITDQEVDFQFQSVSGLSAEMTTEEITEGGENRFKHKLPLRATYPNLVLKRGLITDSKLITWCRNAIENFVFKPTDLTVKLLNNEHEPLTTWNVVHAYPVKWSVSEFDAEKNSVVIETIELAYRYFKT